MSDLTGEQIDAMRIGLLRGNFKRALVNLIGHDLSADEIRKTETFLDSFTDDSIIIGRKTGTVKL